MAFAFRSGGGTVARSAVAMADSTACFMLGSYAAAVRSGESALLSSVLGQVNSSLDLGVVGYTGLLDANVNLSDVAAHLGMATVTQLAGSTVAIKDLYLAMASALQTGGNAADAAVLARSRCPSPRSARSTWARCCRPRRRRPGAWTRR